LNRLKRQRASFTRANIPAVAGWREAFQISRMTPLRKKILTLGRKYDGQIMTAEQAMSLQGTLNSMDDTLTDDEVWMFLSMFAEGRDPISSSGRTSRISGW
jgi:hypothetical protein